MDLFLGNDENKKTILKFMESEENEFMLIISPSGSGKTSFCKMAFDIYKNTYRICSPSVDIVDNHKGLIDKVSNFLQSKDVSNINAPQRKLIFFDDIDILFSLDRYANSYIQTLISKTKIIATCSSGEERKATELKKKCKLIVRLENPSRELIREKYGENIPINCECNVGHMLRSNLSDLKYFDKNIYQIVDSILKTNDGLKRLERAISSDPSLISFMMYDNYQKIIKTPKNWDAPQKISKIYCDTCILEDFSFKNNEWYLIEILNLIRCQSIRLELEKILKKDNLLSHEIQYTQITSRAAQHYSMNKKYTSLHKFNFDNIALYSEISHTKKIKLNLKDPFGSICNAYIFNFCKNM